MDIRTFDRKFGIGFVAALPETPAVYLFRTGDGTVIYVGKAKNIRRRLGSYRSVSRRRVHRKMCRIVREAATVEIQHQKSEVAALVLENRLIRQLRPQHNVEGTYSFLYPAIGLGIGKEQTQICFTTHTCAWSIDVEWYGVFRSRLRARHAFDAIVTLLELLGHREGTKQLPPHPTIRGSRIVAFRRVPESAVAAIGGYLAGHKDTLGPLVELLTDKGTARRRAQHVQEQLEVLRSFHRSDLTPLRRAMKKAGRHGFFVPQEDRDTLFLQTTS